MDEEVLRTSVPSRTLIHAVKGNLYIVSPNKYQRAWNPASKSNLNLNHSLDKMAPKPPTSAKKKSDDTMTQKSLMNFFAKPGSPAVPATKNASTSAKVTSTPAGKSSTSTKTQPSSGSIKASLISKPKPTPKTPDSRLSSDIDIDAGSSKDTPPTSDPITIDVDMLSDDDYASVKKSANVRVIKILPCNFFLRYSFAYGIDALNEAQDRVS